MEVEKLTPQQLGGRARAKQQRLEAIEKYYLDPKYCKYCSKVIEVKDDKKVSDTRKQKFCNKSCSVSLNNKLYPKRSKVLADGSIEKIKTYIRKEGVTPYDEHIKKISILNKTKGQLFEHRNGWQNARSSIQRSARNIFFKHHSKDGVRCLSCGYALHVDVCHIKSVSSFSNDTLVSDINDINNLVGLCKNHHWEFDNGHLTMDEIVASTGVEPVTTNLSDSSA
jgi:predicted restriction endonuclease